MLFYKITDGVLSQDETPVLSKCYSGGFAGSRPEAVNNPAYCQIQNVGPLPPGQYTLGPLINHVHLGPAMKLTPAQENKMFGRGEMYVHYNNWRRDAGLAPYPQRVGRNSSDGCIVSSEPSSLNKLEKLRAAGDDQLTVTI